MQFVSFAEVEERFKGKRVAVVGSGPSVLSNKEGFVDSHDIVVRVNNYKLGPCQGFRCDVFYSFFGASIRKTPDDLIKDGVTLCMSKVPNGQPLDSKWHTLRKKRNGIDFRYIYTLRRDWWFCDTWVPTNRHFLRYFTLLARHVPTTGFSAILDVLEAKPASVYLTGFDFFTSGIHNVNEKWRKNNSQDPIGHRPELELEWLARRRLRLPITFDDKLHLMMNRFPAAEIVNVENAELV